MLGPGGDAPPPPPSYEEAVLIPTAPPEPTSTTPLTQPYPSQTAPPSSNLPYPSQSPYPPQPAQPPYPPQQPQPPYPYQAGQVTNPAQAPYPGSQPGPTANTYVHPPVAFGPYQNQNPYGLTHPQQPGYVAVPGQPVQYTHSVVTVNPTNPGVITAGAYQTTPVVYGGPTPENRARRTMCVFVMCFFVGVVILIIVYNSLAP